jgi:hypothetical protein
MKTLAKKDFTVNVPLPISELPINMTVMVVPGPQPRKPMPKWIKIVMIVVTIFFAFLLMCGGLAGVVYFFANYVTILQ